MARSSSADMKLTVSAAASLCVCYRSLKEAAAQVLSGSWTGSLSNYTGTVLGQKQHGLTTEWVRISTNVTVTDPSTSCFQVRVSGAVGQLWVDDFFVGKSQDRARHVAAKSVAEHLKLKLV